MLRYLFLTLLQISITTIFECLSLRWFFFFRFPYGEGFVFFLFSNPSCRGRDQKHRDSTAQILKHKWGAWLLDGRNSSMCRRLWASLGWNHIESTWLTGERGQWIGLLCLQWKWAWWACTEQLFGSKKRRQRAGGFRESATYQPRVLHESNLILSQCGSTLQLELLYYSEEAVHWKIFKFKRVAFSGTVR